MGAAASTDRRALGRGCLAIDIGGTKIAAGVVDEAGDVRVCQQVPTPDSGEAAVVYRAVLDLAASVAASDPAGAELVVCGVGCGGPMEVGPGGGQTVSPLNIPAWRAFPLGAQLAADLGLPTVVENDAKALALAEGWRGAAQGEPNYLAMVVSTGVGGGLVVDGRLLDGAAGNAGHIGHVVVEPGGRPCACGSRGCLEAEASGSAIAAITGAPPAQADPEVQVRVGRLVGRAVATVVALLDLPLVVVAGSVALGYGSRFFTAANDELGRTATIGHARGARILPAGLGASGPIVGAGAVGLRALGPTELLAAAGSASRGAVVGAGR